jgi:hypothetical protein
MFQKVTSFTRGVRVVGIAQSTFRSILLVVYSYSCHTDKIKFSDASKPATSPTTLIIIFDLHAIVIIHCPTKMRNLEYSMKHLTNQPITRIIQICRSCHKTHKMYFKRWGVIQITHVINLFRSWIWYCNFMKLFFEKDTNVIINNSALSNENSNHNYHHSFFTQKIAFASATVSTWTKDQDKSWWV